MKKILTILLILLGSLGLSSKEDTDEHTVTLGTNLGLNLFNSDFTNLGNANSCCPGFQSGFGTAINFVGSYNYPIKKGTKLFVSLDYMSMNSDFVVDEIEEINLIGTIRKDARIEQRVDSDLNSIGFGLGVIYELFDSFDASLGYRLGVTSDLSYRQTEILIEPSEGLFQETESKTLTDVSGTINSSLMNSIIGKIAYRLYTNSDRTTYLNPNISFNIGLNSINSQMNLVPNSLNFGIDWAYSFSSESSNNIEVIKEENISPNKKTEPEIALLNTDKKKVNNPSVIIRPVSIDKNEQRNEIIQIELDEVNSIRMVPILNYIFFDKDSSSLSPRYSALNKKESYSFNTSNLFEVNTLSIYHHILNIIGSRMLEYPDSELRIVGTKSEIETGEIAKILPIERAKTIRDYLVKTWGISEKRLILTTSEKPTVPSTSADVESIEENQRVELYSDNKKILEPLLLKDTLYTTITKEIDFYTIIDTNMKDYSWSFKVYNDESSPYFEVGGRFEPPIKTIFPITEEVANQIKDKNELTYRFDLIRQSEEQESVTGKINISINSLEKKKRDKKQDFRIDKYSLILFDFDKFDLNEKNKEIIEIIRKNINKDSELIISGYSDKIGDSDYNKELSKKRTESVSSVFPENKKELYPYGESIILFNNKLPEGRFYSRTVIINATTPIKK